MIHIICIDIVISLTYFNKNDKWNESLSQFTHITEYLIYMKTIRGINEYVFVIAILIYTLYVISTIACIL